MNLVTGELQQTFHVIEKPRFRHKNHLLRIVTGVLQTEGCNGLCEYVSRVVRSKLIRLLMEEFGSISDLARKLNISHAAVIKWLHPKGVHPSNTNLQRIIKLALGLRPDETIEILARDLSRHTALMEKLRKSYHL